MEREEELKIIKNDMLSSRDVKPIEIRVRIPTRKMVEDNFKLELLYQKYLLNKLHKRFRKL